MDFDVLPGEFLPQPVEACLGGQAYRLLALGRLDLLVQEDVDAERVDVGVAHGGVGRKAQLWAQQVGAEVGQAFDLGEKPFFAGEIE